jgi:hypothetical protein
MTCSVLIDLSFFVAKEGIHKEEPSVFGNRHEFFSSEPCIFRLYKKYHYCIIILILILIILIIITSIIRKYVKVVLDCSWSITVNYITFEDIWERSDHLRQGCPLNIYGSHPVVLTIKHTTFAQSNTTQVYLIKIPSYVCYMFRPALRLSWAVSTQAHLQEDTIDI